MEIKNLISKQVWEDRYKKETDLNENDNIGRVSQYIGITTQETVDFFDVMERRLFYPAGRTMSNSGIGTELTLNNCFNSNHVPDNIEGIFDRVKLGALTHKRGGGIGYDFSLIRPDGTPTSNDAVASGVVSFMEVFNTQTATILQGGRRGANMGILNIYHPDIFEYLESKSWDEGKLNHFNLSIMIDDDFMKAVENDENIYLHYPVYDENSKIIKDESKWKIKKEIRAIDLWDIIMKKAYNTGEYGVFFYDSLNRDNNTWYCETIVSTNPCGEYCSGTLHGVHPQTEEILVTDDFMGACNLGSVFLHNYVKNPFTADAHFDFALLEDTIFKAVRFLDNVIDINKYPHKSYENYQKNLRTIGLGFTGLADMLVMLNMKYGDADAIEFTHHLLNEYSKIAYRASIELAKEKGQFPLLDREKFVQSNFINKHITIDPEWLEISNDILRYGIRNARILSVAPTGTLSLTFGENCSSGLEPIFCLEYQRDIKIGGQDDNDIQRVDMRDYAYEMWLNTKAGNIVTIDKFVTAMDLPVSAHVEMLSVIAFHTDMSCSKTINVPTDYPFEDTKQVYMDCWKKGIKGCTIFRPNPLRKGILITNDESDEEKAIDEAVSEVFKLKRGDWKPTAEDTVYMPRKVYIGCGKLKLMIGWSKSEQAIQDFYVIRSGSGGCERNLQGMVIAMSGMLRLGGNLFNIEKAFEGVGGCNSFTSKRSKGAKLSKGNSCGTAILKEIKAFVKEMHDNNDSSIKLTNSTLKESVAVLSTITIGDVTHNLIDNSDEFTKEQLEFKKENGDIAYAMRYGQCPACNEELQHSGGCLTCVACGFTKCE